MFVGQVVLEFHPTLNIDQASCLNPNKPYKVQGLHTPTYSGAIDPEEHLKTFKA